MHARLPSAPLADVGASLAGVRRRLEVVAAVSDARARRSAEPIGAKLPSASTATPGSAQGSHSLRSLLGTIQLEQGEGDSVWAVYELQPAALVIGAGSGGRGDPI
jgi:hypothetical protein